MDIVYVAMNWYLYQEAKQSNMYWYQITKYYGEKENYKLFHLYEYICL